MTGRPIELDVLDLTLRRGERLLVQGLGFDARPGAFVELTGANGAGKTTLLRALAGFVRPEAGSIALRDGSDDLDAESRAGLLHILGHRDGLKGPLDARAHLAFWCGVLGAGRDAIGAALERVGLAPIADLPARALSAGQGRRLALARLIAAPRPLWLLDEPAAALDASGKALVAAMVEAHRASGGIVIAAVHEPLGPEPSLSLRLGAP